jgi:hypothetical protein
MMQKVNPGSRKTEELSEAPEDDHISCIHLTESLIS